MDAGESDDCCHPFQVFRVNANGSGRAQLTDPPGISYAPKVARRPGGRLRPVRWREEVPNYSVYAVDAGGGEPASVTKTPLGAHEYSLA